MKRQNARLETFLSLAWYEVTLRFLFTFVAKTSEVLLAAGLVVSTANFLTDGSILATFPAVSVAWAWAQALAIDSSLGVSLSYAFQCLKQEEWVRGALYGLLTLLLAGVAGGITNVDIVSHALHLSMNDAMVQMGINVAILSRLRAIAVIGFILMSRLRDLPALAPPTKMEPEPQPSMAPVNGPSQEPQIQTTIQSLCSQFSGEEMAQILNACIVAKKMTLVQMAPKGLSEPEPPVVDQQRQGHSLEHASEPRAIQGKPEPFVAPPLQSEHVPVSSMEPARKVSLATEPPVPEEHHPRKDPGPFSQVQGEPEPIAEVPLKKSGMEQMLTQEPDGTGSAPLEPDGVPPQQRLEQAYQSLIAEGKKPSGRALAERAHVHRSTCVEWLRMKQHLTPENELLPEELEPNRPSLRDTLPVGEGMDLPEKAPESEIVLVQAEPPERAMMDLPEMKMNQESAVGNISRGVFPDSSLLGDIPDV